MKEVLQGTNGLLEYRHDNGELSQVCIEHAGIGTRRAAPNMLPVLRGRAPTDRLSPQETIRLIIQ